MKKTLVVLSLVFVLVAALTVSVFALTPTEAGVYEIGSAEDLIAFKDMANASLNNGNTTVAYKAVLTADIDLTGKEWTPFQKVVMHFDGQGHTIKGMTYTNAAATGFSGMFANVIANGHGVHSTMKNVTFEDCTFNVTMNGGNQEIAMIAGRPDRAAVYDIVMKNCDMNIDGTGAETIVGMVAGRAAYEHNDFGTVAVGAKVDAESVITVAEGTTFTGEKRFGGIAGASNQVITIIRSEFKGQIVGVDRKASLICDVWNKAIFCGYDAEENTYPELYIRTNSTVFMPYVSTADELLTIAELINAGSTNYGCYLTADIDMTGKVWTPITGKYLGIIDGAGHTISGITLNYTDAEAGFYGIIANELSNGNGMNGTVCNLTIKDSSITVALKEGASGNTFVGGVTGQSDRGHVQNVTLENVDVALVGNPGGEVGVGGAIGKAQWAGPKGHVSVYGVTTDKDCSVVASTGDNGNSFASGIVGRKSSNSGEFRDCVNNATVFGTDKAAGIVGGAWHDTNTFSNCKNYGNIYGEKVVAPIAALVDSCTVVANNVVAGGFISGTGTVGADFGAYAGNATLADGATIKAVAIAMDATEEGDVLAYYQTRVSGEGKVDIRLIFMAELEYLVANSDLAIKVEFKKDDAVVKTYNGSLGNEVYKSVIADGDYYHGSEDIVLFGNIFTGVPTADVNGFTITVTDGAGATVYTGSAVLGE